MLQDARLIVLDQNWAKSFVTLKVTTIKKRDNVCCVQSTKGIGIGIAPDELGLLSLSQKYLLERYDLKLETENWR